MSADVVENFALLFGKGIRALYDPLIFRHDSVDKPILETKATVPGTRPPRPKGAIETDVYKYKGEVVKKSEDIVANSKRNRGTPTLSSSLR